MQFIGDTLSNLYLLKDMSRAYRRIVEVYVEWQAKVYRGLKSAIFPGRELIAAQAKCSVSTVRNFIRDFEGILITHENRRQKGSQKNESNLYQVCPHLFETIISLKFMNLFHKFDAVADQLIIDISENPYFLSEKVLKKHRLSTQKLPTAYAGKLPTIKSYINSYLDKGTKKEKVPDVNIKKEGEAKMAILQGLPLNFTTKQKAVRYFEFSSLREAKSDFVWLEKRKMIKMPDRFFLSRLKEHQTKFINRI